MFHSSDKSVTILVEKNLPEVLMIKLTMRPAQPRANRLMASLTCALILVIGTVFSMPSIAQGVPQTQLPRTTLNAGMHLMQVQLAQNFEQRQMGLMWRKEMPQNEGMLFVFEQPASQCFWMRNTLIPLSAAFVADDGSIVNIADMKPMSDESHCSVKPVRFVLEMNQGWFAKRNIQAGYKLTGPVFSK